MPPPFIKNIKDNWSKILAKLQSIGKALMFPIAVLPIAALLTRLGALIEDPSSNGSIGLSTAQIFIGSIIRIPGNIVFDNLAIIFAIGIGFGLAKDNRGEAALVAAILWFGMTYLLGEKGGLAKIMWQNVLTSDTLKNSSGVAQSQLLYFLKNQQVIYQLDTGVVGGITSGAIVAFLYNRFHTIKLPEALSFFGGRRFVPMLGVIVIVPVALFFAVIWPWLQFALIKVGTSLSNTSSAVKGVSTGTYAILNRLLQPFGLHHIINTFVWFQLPITGNNVNTGVSQTHNGDITAFYAGTLGSGLFTTGFFPLFLGGLPGCALAMIMTSDKQKRKQMFYFFGGSALVAFLTGIDEPLIFSFIFISPLLYVLNSLLTGLFYMIVIYTQMSIGFGFSAGFIDYIVSFKLSWDMAQKAPTFLANPLFIWVWAAIMFAVYYFVFFFVITKMKVPTPGRELILGLDTKASPLSLFKKNEKNKKIKTDKYQIMAEKFLEIIKPENIQEVGNCASRLRLIVTNNSPNVINDNQIKAAGGKGIVRLGNKGLQIIVGTDVEHVADHLKRLVEEYNSTKKNLYLQK